MPLWQGSPVQVSRTYTVVARVLFKLAEPMSLWKGDTVETYGTVGPASVLPARLKLTDIGVPDAPALFEINIRSLQLLTGCTGRILADAAGGLIGRKFGPKKEKIKMRAPCAKEHAF